MEPIDIAMTGLEAANHYAKLRKERIRETAMFWASCGPCGETWSVVSHPDWLPGEEAAKEVRGMLWDHEYKCPIKNLPNEMGFLNGTD